MKLLIGAMALIQLLSMQMPKENFFVESNSQIMQESREEISTMAVKTKWYYRDYNGVRQKRLMSLVSGKWLTDWINC